MPIQPWQIDLQNCVRSLDELERYIPIENKDRLREVLQNMRLSITPHTLSLIDWNNPNDPILLMCVPSDRELRFSPEELTDPIGDEAKSPIPFLTHRYPDRVLVYATFFCSLFCRFCFRRTKTGEATPGPSVEDRERIVNYLEAHPEVDEVILTGGDPLTLLDEQLEDWFRCIRSISTISRIRIHTRVPVNLPSRITDTLVELFRKYSDATHPIYIVTHFNHPNEIAQENIEVIARLVDAGIVVRNQGPLLRGVNDDPVTLETLFKKLTNIRVVPYYLHQLDLAKGTNHFRVPIERGIKLMQELQGRVTGIALPRYVIDLPGGKGKVPLTYRYTKKQTDFDWEIESPFGDKVEYREPIDVRSRE
jgi:lysine 2,3-aminomutase